MSTFLRLVQNEIKCGIISCVKNLFPGEQDVPCQHAGHTWNLFLLVHYIIPGNVGLKIKCHLPTNPERKSCQTPRHNLLQVMYKWNCRTW